MYSRHETSASANTRLSSPHMPNVWIGAVTKSLSTYLNEILACDLNTIDFCYRVSTMCDAVLRADDKEFSLSAVIQKDTVQSVLVEKSSSRSILGSRQEAIRVWTGLGIGGSSYGLLE